MKKNRTDRRLHMLRIFLAVFQLALFLASTPSPSRAAISPQGTEGDEARTADPEQLEVWLGSEWAGKQFRLKTDSGTYPGTITVGEDGTLRLEIGGSSRYVLSAVDAGTKGGSGKAQALATEGTDREEASAMTEDGHAAASGAGMDQGEATPPGIREGSPLTGEDADGRSVAGIPLKHLILFAMGLSVSGGSLLFLWLKGRNDAEDGYDDDDGLY